MTNASMPQTQTDVSQAIQHAARLHQRGAFDQAEAIYAAILTAQPDHFDALHMLGVLCFQQGRRAEARDLISTALNVDPGVAAAWSNLGLVHASLGDAGEACACYDRAIMLKPDHAEAFNNRGNALVALKRPAEAIASYDQAVALSPDYAQAFNNRGVVLYDLGSHADAVASFDRALAIRPDDADAHFNRGRALQSLGRGEEAVASYDRVLALRPGHGEALSRRGNAEMSLGRPAAALASYEMALVSRPNDIEMLYNRGIALKELQRFAEAVASYDAALALWPDYAQALYNRGNALMALGHPGPALADYDRAAALKPDLAAVHNNRGLALIDLDRPEDALADFDRALALDPEDAEAHNNRGIALIELGRAAEAVASIERALALKPDYAEAHTNRGIALGELGRSSEALASFDAAVSIKPDYADARLGRGQCLLLHGDFAAGWREFEWRWQAGQLRHARRDFAPPQWRGDADLAGRTILLHGEQGFGDTIQFCRYAKLFDRPDVRVVLEVQPELAALVASLGGVEVIARGDPLPAFDYHCPLMSLPAAFGTTLDSVPTPIPYLAAPVTTAARWRDRLGAPTKPRIGLVWAGSPRHARRGADRLDRRRSIAFDQLAPLIGQPDYEFHSLQKGDDAVDELRRSPHAGQVVDHADDLHDFAATAGLLANLDLVITVDTAVAHLAGALGKPFWLMNRFNTCWRWLRDRDDTPWYPAARIFRQPAPGDWAAVVGSIVYELRLAGHGRLTGHTAPSPRSVAILG